MLEKFLKPFEAWFLKPYAARGTADAITLFVWVVQQQQLVLAPG
jgi:hypothetical protein